MSDQVVARHAGEGDPIWMLGGLYEVKARGEETGGRVTAMEMTIPEGMGPPPHTHDGPELVYVLEGSVRYHIDGEVVEGGPGSFFYLPPDTLENFEPTELTRLFVVYLPGGVDRFFDEAGEAAPARELPPPLDGPPDVESLAAIASRYGLEIKAPMPS